MSQSHDEKNVSKRLSRRKFLKGFGLTSIGVAAAGGGILGNVIPDDHANGSIMGPEAVPITLNVNGKNYTVKVEPRTTLVEALREQLHLTGTKIGCDRGACGACTVIVDGKTLASCLTLAIDVVGLPIQTIEGLETNGQMHPVQQAFINADALQCGFCTPGMIMSCKNLLDHKANPTLDDIKTATSGNLCRCGTYPKVFEAVLKSKKA
ncbi:(2Fe-2S)-binding protein [bacterium]|nr:(2Fe-2S)-binding protein [bacterium]